jgi:hypothetical protein
MQGAGRPYRRFLELVRILSGDDAVAVVAGPVQVVEDLVGAEELLRIDRRR